VRQAVSVITMLAAVIHLTFGCCLHPEHFGAAGCVVSGCVVSGRGASGCVVSSRGASGCDISCSGGVEAAAPDRCCDGHDHGAEPFRPGQDAGHSGQDAVAGCTAGHAADAHGCAGCHCVATPEPPAFPSLVTCVTWVGDAFGRRADGTIHVPRLHAAERHPEPSTGHPALFERFLA